MRWEREGSNEAHGCLTSEVPSLASWGRLRHIHPPNLWLIPEDFNPVPGDPLLKSLATTLIKHTWSGQSSSSRLLENCRQVCWSRLEINFPGEWVPRSRVEDLWHIPSPKITTHSPIHVMKRIEFLKTHISPTHSSFLFHMRVYIDQSSLHTKKCCKCFCICCLTFFCLFVFLICTEQINHFCGCHHRCVERGLWWSHELPSCNPWPVQRSTWDL